MLFRSAEATPGPVTQCADDGLYENAHEWRQYPEVAQVMGSAPNVAKMREMLALCRA